MSEIRSVSVHLDADVASYVAKMRLAGDETDKAFSRVNDRLTTTNSALGDVEGGLDKVTSAERRVSTESTRMESSMRRVETRARTTESAFTRVTTRIDGFLGKLGLLPALAIAGGSALIPLTGAVGGLAAALAAPIAFVGLGGLLFGFLGSKAIQQTQKQYKTIGTLQKAVESARASLEADTRSAGKNAATSATVANAQERYNKALAAYKTALSGLSPQQRQFHNALEGLDSDFAKFIRGPAGADLLAPFTQGLKVADDLLPHAKPIITATSGALADLLSQLDKYSQTPGFDRFVHEMASQIGPDIKDIGSIAGHAAPGIERLLVLFGKDLSPGLLHGLDHVSADFDHWANSKQGRQDVESFIRYVHQVGPEVGDDLEAVARAGAHLVHALAPLGPPTLHVIKEIADVLSKIPTPVLTALAGAAAGSVAFQKVGGFKVAGKLPAAGGIGRNILSELTGGLISPSSKYGRGVTPVYVTNPGFGGGGGPGGLLKKTLPFAEEATVGDFGAAVAGGLTAVGITGAAIFAMIKETQTPKDRTHPTNTNLTTSDYQRFNQQRLNANTGGMGSEDNAAIRATGTAAQSVRRQLADVSQQIDQIGPNAHQSIGQATQEIHQLGAELAGLVAHPARLLVELQAEQAIRGLQALQAYTLRDKSFTVTERFQQIERTVGPGGGIQRGNADGGTIGGLRYPYGDKVWRRLAPGEEVISNRHGQADMNRSALKAANRGARLAVVGMAVGGTVMPAGWSPAPAGGHATRVIERVVERLPRSMRLDVDSSGGLVALIDNVAQGTYEANQGFERAMSGG